MFEQLVELHDMAVRHLVLSMKFGAIAASDVEVSMRLIAREVIPRADQRPGETAAA